MKSMTPEEKATGKSNYYEAVGVSRRDMLKGVVASGAVSMGGLGAAYFGYGDKMDNPVRVGVIGTGDEGGVLIGALNPNYIQVVAIADIRPYNVHRALHGDWGGSDPQRTHDIRTGLMEKYGWSTEDEARKHVKVYEDYRELLKNDDVEAVIIALPLFLHAVAAVDAMIAGKHVLTEKLMAHSVAQCKVMSRVSEEQGLYLTTGHQRHYSVLYDNAVNLIQWGVLGQVHHIRAQWHRGNLPGRDSWQPPLPGGEEVVSGGTTKVEDRILKELRSYENKVKSGDLPAAEYDIMQKKVAQWTAWNEDRKVSAKDFGYEDLTLSNGRKRSAMEELCRWRLWERTGGGLMAELGSHQLDASSIFVSALHNRGKARKDQVHVHPLSVHAVGGRHVFALDRDADDHVYCMFEFPGPHYDSTFDVGYRDSVSNLPDPKTGVPGYDTDPNKKIVVTYSSINGNGFGGYGEVVLGSKGTLILETEQEVMLYRDDDTSSRIKVKDSKAGPVLDTQASGAPTADSSLAKAADSGPISRGYTEEMEHWAWLIRNADPRDTDVDAQPRCRPEVAMGDGIIALTSNIAIKRSSRGESGYIEFKDAWFDIHSDETPDGSDVTVEYDKLVKKA
ncbi:MAG: Gfo/Idh/MocA family oxidoreductase [Planctomycetaceae bacterium]|nr:Gfo/Idh/MocA family oxidoreductase [Planctomycetaceae bacterium]MCB9938169.1 Gfo/Idh/MocA family oxidoreductase [Planctomycetaceae bacterium]